MFSTFNIESNKYEPLTLEHHYNRIKQYDLVDTVSDNVYEQYDIARNLYIYAWFEYRFFNVAETKAFLVLEYAIRERIGKQRIQTYINKRKAVYKEECGKNLRLSDSLKTLIEYCRDFALIENKGFSTWRNRQKRLAKQDYADRVEKENRAAGKTSWCVDDSKVEYERFEIDYDYIQVLIDTLNKTRNSYAHGSPMLSKWGVESTILLVSEFINQIYSKNI